MSLDIPEQVRATASITGNQRWLRDLPNIVDSLAKDWSLAIGGSLPGGHAALVVEATPADGSAAVLKIKMPSEDLAAEAAVLRVANGDGCALLLNEDPSRRALLMERLGAPMHDAVSDPFSRHLLLCTVAARLWRPVDCGADLPTGATFAEQCADRLPQMWELVGRPCSPAALRDALECTHRRRRAHDDRSALLVHGDIHEMNTLQSRDGSYRLIDPVGLRAEPACDLGTIIRCIPVSVMTSDRSRSA